jgi:PPOX class probable F420-dependent enzyme
MPKMSARVETFLKDPHFAKIATLMKDGRPQLTPIWYMVEGGKIFVNTSTTRTKFKNMKRDPRVAFLVDDGYPFVSIFGRARIAAERDPNKDIESLAIRYRGEARGKRDARAYYWKQPRVSLEIVPDKIVVDL